MRERISRATKRVKENPVLRETAKNLRPSLTIWGFLGTLLFFILPEIIGFWRGKEIASWAHAKYLQEPLEIGRATYWLIEKFFKDGGSYLNLSIGLALLYWMWSDWRKQRREKERWESIKL